jgi:alpha-ketoglutarate-dependent taurine dioxygenase
MASNNTEARRPGIGSVRRQAVDTTQLVQTSLMSEGQNLPLVITPAIDGVDLAAWAHDNKEQIERYQDKHGGILFRGFGLKTVEDFEGVCEAICPELFAEYGDLPPESDTARVYGVTPYPPDKTILFHNESSHLPTWPMKQFFFCQIPAAEGGATPLYDGRVVLSMLDPEVARKFEEKGLMYVRNFSEGVDVPWQDFFHTEDKSEVERICAESGMTCEWTDVGLRVKNVTQGVATHPRTGEKIFFNQVQLHHVACLDPETRDSLRALFAEEDLPRNVYYGDGTPIPDETIEHVSEVFEQACVEFQWQPGDLVAVDNMLVAHARRPYKDPRKMLVCMGEMVSAADLERGLAKV